MNQDLSDTNKKSIIFVCGLLTPKWAVKPWKKYLQKAYPNYKIHVIGNTKYTFKDIKTMKLLISKIEKLVLNSSSSILIGHSMGGILVGSLAQEIYTSNKIEKIITINSPHTMNIKKPNIFTINDVRREVNYKENFDTFQKTLTFGSYFDMTVPKKYAHTLHSKKVNLFMEHYLLFYISLYHIKKIIRFTKYF